MTTTRTRWPDLMSHKTAAEYLDRSPRYLSNLVKAGLIIPRREGSEKRYSIEEMERYKRTLPEWDVADS